MNAKIRMLIVEDSEADAELALRELARGGLDIEPEVVATPQAMREALERREWDLVLCDYSLPSFSAPEALKLLRRMGLADIPFVLYSGAIGEEVAVEIMRAGAADFVPKGNLKRLVPVVTREMDDAKTRRARRMAEDELKRLYTAIEQSVEAVVITDIAANIMYVNAAFERISGYHRAEVIGKNPRIMQSGKQDAEFYRKMWATLTGGMAWSGRFVNKKKDGTLFEEDATISPVMNDAGKITNYVAIKRDVTREAMLERAKDYFTNITSHEMRTPLSKLVLVKTLLANCADGGKAQLEKVHEVLDEAYANFERISSATSLISDLALVKGKLEPCLVGQIIVVAVIHMKDRLLNAGRNIALREDLSQLPEDATILGNPKMIGRLLNELFSNAAKYTPDGKGVAVRARLEGGSVVLEIIDEGVGIPADQREAVFQPFFSLENPLHHLTGEYSFQSGGIGLGLTLAKMIVDFHGGAIALSSGANGLGTTVAIRLPVMNQAHRAE